MMSNSEVTDTKSLEGVGHKLQLLDISCYTNFHAASVTLIALNGLLLSFLKSFENLEYP